MGGRLLVGYQNNRNEKITHQNPTLPTIREEF